MFHLSRRQFIHHSLTLGNALLAYTSGLLPPVLANMVWKPSHFAAQTLEQAIQQVIGDQQLLETRKIKLRLPQVAENGKVVPITILSSLKNVENVYLFVEKNPFPHIANFQLAPGTLTEITARIKMAETCDVIVIIKDSDNEYYITRQQVKVTQGGCGG